MGLMEKRLPLYLGAILLSSCGAAFARIANAWIVESVITSAQNRDAEGLFLRVGLPNFRFNSAHPDRLLPIFLIQVSLPFPLRLPAPHPLPPHMQRRRNCSRSALR